MGDQIKKEALDTANEPTENVLSFHEKVVLIQGKLKVPKSNKTVSKGKVKYYHRSCADILEEIKPYLNQYRLVLTISCDVKEVAGQPYIVATAIVTDGTESYIGSGCARDHLGQSYEAPAQETGKASSYARKYALEALFSIDNTKDNDFKDEPKQEVKQQKAFRTPSQTKLISPSQTKLISPSQTTLISRQEEQELREYIKSTGLETNAVLIALNKFGAQRLSELEAKDLRPFKSML